MMKVRELVSILKDFPADAEVHLGLNWPDRVTETYERVWVSSYGAGPQINAAIDYLGLSVFVGCSLQQRVENRPQQMIDLGQYRSAEEAAKVRDFYVVHRGLEEPLNFPAFDYDKWIPPRTITGEYNEHIAKILREELLSD